VFFDALGIAYEYEKEGYDLGPLGWYLPDFWLPQLYCFAEVKPTAFSPEEFARAAGVGRTLLLEGAPDVKLYRCTMPPDACGHIPRRPDTCFFCEDGGALVNLVYSAYKGQLWFDFGEGLEVYSPFMGKFQCAVDAARAARFEHGETPTPPRSPFAPLATQLSRTLSSTLRTTL
jgi:hypothetical protein